MIPKTIHYCWFGGGAFNETIERCVASWRRVMPDYQVKRWDETNVPGDLPYLRQSLRFRRWALASDYIRLHALLTEGGVYLDTDVEAFRPFDPLLADRGFVGFEETDPALARRWIGNAVIGAESGHPFIAENLRALQLSMRIHLKPHYGVRIVNIALRDHGLHDYGEQTVADMHVYPREVLHPDKTAIPEGAYCVHWMQASWHKKPGLKHQWASFKYKSARLPGMLLGRLTTRERYDW